MRIILLSGPVASGKSALAQGLEKQFDLRIVRTRDLLEELVARRGRPRRVNLQQAGDRLDRQTKGKWVVQELDRQLRGETRKTDVIVDSVRSLDQIDELRRAYGSAVTHIHVTAVQEILQARYASRQDGDGLSYDQVRKNRTERLVDRLGDTADLLIDTGRCTDTDVLVRAASYLGFYGEVRSGIVDVIIGGQYGSEGKGQIAAFLAKEYDLLVRVGGPNAGHKVFEIPEPYTHHQLPSGTRRATQTQLLIGPGAVLDVDKLLKEISDCGVGVGRLMIDEAAMVITDTDRHAEQELVRGIGSTGQGVGAATARRIMARSGGTKLARDVPELRPFMSSAVEILAEKLAEGGRVCLEGTQGTALSLYHGSYPHVTSRDTTVAGCLAEAGIPPGRVRRVVMVCRTYPIRVENPVNGSSGPMSQEIDLKTVSERSGIDLLDLEETERTSTTGRRRRISEFDWRLLRRSSLLNLPTDIALTFADYLTIKNRDARRFEQLHPETINFIQDIERVSSARVSLISTGFSLRSIIDRRAW